MDKAQYEVPHHHVKPKYHLDSCSYTTHSFSTNVRALKLQELCNKCVAHYYQLKYYIDTQSKRKEKGRKEEMEKIHGKNIQCSPSHLLTTSKNC